MPDPIHRSIMKKASRKTSRRRKTGPQAHRQFSGPMVDGPDRAGSRSMLYAVGFKREDFNNPLVIGAAVVSAWLGLSGVVLLFGAFSRRDFRYLFRSWRSPSAIKPPQSPL